jgi:putative ABC transport system permease protein
VSRLLYSLRLVIRSLRRDPAFTAVMIATLALSVSLFVTAVAAYRRSAAMPAGQPRFPGVYRVQLRHNPLLPFYAMHEEFSGFAAAASNFVSQPQSRALRGTGIPRAESPTFIAPLWAGVAGGQAGSWPVRFCTTDLFTLFAIPFRHGAPWGQTASAQAPESRRADAVDDAGVVLNDVLNTRWFGGANSVGRHVVIEGRRLTVVGVLARPLVPWPLWDFNPFEERGELLVPWSLAERLRPAPAVVFPPMAPASWETLASAPHRFIEQWVWLPEGGALARFEARMASVDGALRLDPYDPMNAAQNKVAPPYIMFLGLTTAVVLANVLNVARLLLAKGMVRSAEIGIHRALGAPRNAIFVRQLMEGVLVVLAGSVAGVVLGVPTVVLFDRLIPDLPIQLTVDVRTAGLSVLVCLLLSLLAGIYPAWRVASVAPTRYLGKI